MSLMRSSIKLMEIDDHSSTFLSVSKNLSKCSFYAIVIRGGLTWELIGARIAEARRVQKLSQAETAQKLGISIQKLSNWERGYSPIPAGALYSISEVLSCPIPYLFCEAGTPLPSLNESEALLISLYRSDKEFHSVVDKLIGAYTGNTSL